MVEKKETEAQDITKSQLLEQLMAMPPQKRLAFFIFMAIAFGTIIYFLFFSSKEVKEEIVKPNNSIVAKPIEIETISNNYLPKAESLLPEVNNLTPPAPPAPPPPLEPIKEEAPPILAPLAEPSPIASPQLPVPTAKKNTKEALSQAQESGISVTNIMTFGGGGSSSDKNDDKDGQIKDNRKDSRGFLGFDGGLIDGANLQPSPAKKISATKIDNNLAYTIVQGKVIDAVLETAINTQMQAGVIRAIVSRDIYGEQGDIILIPKGSRLVGSYASASENSSGGNNGNGAVLTRVFAAWNRIITPNGMDINLSPTPSSDPLGRNGIPGYLDTNLQNNLLNAFLVSILGPYLAAQITNSGKEQITINNNNDGKGNVTSSTTSTLGAKVLNDGIQQFQNIAKEQLNKIYPPGVTTIFVDQGTKIDVIVQEDIIFPKDSTNNSQNLP
jgi:type IV secretion system protein VirB10